MARSSTILGRNTTNKLIRAKSLTTVKANICQAFLGIHKKGTFTSEHFTRASLLSSWPCTQSTKRKSEQMTVEVPVAQAGQSVCCTALVGSPRFQTTGLPQKHHSSCSLACVQASSVCNGDDSPLCETNFFNTLRNNDDEDDRYTDGASNTSKHSGMCTHRKMTDFLFSKLLSQRQNVRHFSRGRRQDYGGDEDDEEKKRKLRGAVMYVSNPLNWISKQWNMAKLRRKLDPTFSENEFLVGAKQAVSHVSQLVSSGRADQLSGLVIDEVIDWLMSYRNSLKATEREALALSVDDVVLVKIRYVHLGDDQEKALAFVDSICFGLRLCDREPYFVDLGIRFKRDYSTTPPSDWVVAGVSHIRLQNLATQ